MLGDRTGHLVRNFCAHCKSVCEFLAELAEQARSQSSKLTRLDPPQRASRYFRCEGRLRLIQPDAFGSRDHPFSLVWERRAIQPSTMADRFAPCLRYFSTHRPIDDCGARPLVLVAFVDELASDHFRPVAHSVMRSSGITLPVPVSHVELMRRFGGMGRAWYRPRAREPGNAFGTPELVS